jgi:hypothetical protein
MAMATGMPPLINNKNKTFNMGFLSNLEVMAQRSDISDSGRSSTVKPRCQ